MVKGAIELLPVDAIVCPGCVDGRALHKPILRRAGRQIEAEAAEAAPIAIGAALVTSAGKLRAAAVIYVPVVSEPDVEPTVEDTRRATRAALVAATVKRFTTIAIPSIGTEDGARAMVDEIRAHAAEWPETIYLVARTAEMIAAFDAAWLHAQQLSSVD